MLPLLVPLLYDDSGSKNCRFQGSGLIDEFACCLSLVVTFHIHHVVVIAGQSLRRDSQLDNADTFNWKENIHFLCF